MLNLWLTLPPCPAGDTAPPVPEACPRAGCGGRRLRRHQAVAKRVRHAGLCRVDPRRAGLRHADLRPTDRHRAVGAHRYRCLTCRRTFRVYPYGVDRGTTTVAVKRFAAALHALGLGVRAVSAVLASLGAPIGKSHVHATARRVIAAMPAPEDARLFAGPWGTDASTGRLWITVGGRPRAVRIGAAAGRPALVIEDVDHATAAAVERWARAALGAFGVSAAIACPQERRDRGACPGRRGGCGPRRNTTHGRGRPGARGIGRTAAAAVDAEAIDPAPVDPTWVEPGPGGADDDLPDIGRRGKGDSLSGAWPGAWPGGMDDVAPDAVRAAASDAVDGVPAVAAVGGISRSGAELGVLDRPRPVRRGGGRVEAARWRARRASTRPKAGAAALAGATAGVVAPA